MSVLQRNPYGLDVGNRIIIRGAALNENGWGTPEIVTTQVMVLGRPARVDMPTCTKIDGQEASLNWNKVEDSTYVVEYRTANEYSEWSQLSDGEWQQNNAIASSLSYGASYYFRVKAKNACGIGPASDYVKVDVPSPPRSPRRPTVT